MKNIYRFVAEVVCDESGQDLIEYSLLSSFVALGAIASIKALALKVAVAFGTIGNTLISST